MTGAAPSAVAAMEVDPPSPTIKSDQIVESSGLAASPTRPGIVWTMNDSGNPAELFALDPNGATVATVKLAGVQSRDWEGIASWRGANGRAFLAVADIGDNLGSRSQLSVEIVAEPKIVDRRRTVRPVRTIRLRYPQGAFDAETVLVDPAGQRMYLVGKSLLNATIWAVPADHFPGEAKSVGVLEKVGSVPMSLVTDGVMLADGRALLRNYGSLALVDSPGERPQVLGTAALPRQQQGEGVTVVQAASGEQTVLLSSEGLHAPLVSLPLTALVQDLSSGDSASLPSPTPPSAAVPDAVAPHDRGQASRWQLAAQGVLALALIGAALLLISRWTRNRS